MSPVQAINFWADAIEKYLLGPGFPAQMGFMKPLIKMLWPKVKSRLLLMDDNGARELINSIHAMSAKLEDQTGENSPFHYSDE